jgi:GNAT superfamily N-acetyltransferase
MSDILKDFSAPAFVAAIEANQLEFWADLARFPQVELHQDREIMWFVTGIPFPMCNLVCRAQFEPGDIDARIKTTLALFKSRHLPMLWHIGPATRPAHLGKYLIAHDLVHAGDDVGMALDLLALNEELPTPSALKIESVSDVVTLKQWFHIFALSFELPEFVGQAIFDIEASSDAWQHLPRRFYIGWLNREPVATAMLFLGAGVAGVYSIGVLPAARRQGVGMAMTLVPLCEARVIGYRIGILHSSPMGLGMYRQLGFQEYCSVSDYIWAGETNRDKSRLLCQTNTNQARR